MKATRKSRRISRSFCLENLENRQLLSGGATFNGGSGNAFAIASDGTLYLAYYVSTDATHGTLHYAIRDSSGAWSADQVLDDSSAQVGLYPSMALDSTGKPAVAYFDGVNADLRYAHYNGTSWDTGIVYSTVGKRGNYPSLAFLSDKPTITHYVKTGTSSGFLAVDQASSVTPSSPSAWTTTTLDNSGNAGRYSSLVYNSGTSKWGVSYDDSGTSTGARYIETSGSSVTSGWGSVATVPFPSGSPASNAVWTSLAYDSSNRPAFAWYDNTSANLNFSHRNGTGGAWQSGVVEANNTTGKYPTLFSESGQFKIAFYREWASKSTMAYGGDVGTAWTQGNDLAGGGSELKAVRRNGVTTFAWSQDSNLYVNDDQTGVGWTKQSLLGAAGPRRFASAVAYDPGFLPDPGAKMWVIGGLNGSQRTNSVAYSDDGLVWLSARSDLTANGFTARDSQASAVFNGKMWVIGGESNGFSGGDLHDVWSSSDGTNWTQAMSGTNAVDLGPRRSATAVVFNNNLFVIGGVSNDSTPVYPTYPVQYSSDGVNWSGVAFTPFQRYGLSALAYDGALYVIGGSGADTHTYSSTNGTSWTDLGAPTASFVNAVGLVFDNKMWMIDGAGANWSTDGIHWTRAPLDPDGVTPFDGRTGMTGVVLPLNGADKMWVLGGYVNQGQIWRDDAWYSS